MGQARQDCPHCGRKPGQQHGAMRGWAGRECPRSRASFARLDAFLDSLRATPVGGRTSDRRIGFAMRRAVLARARAREAGLVR